VRKDEGKNVLLPLDTLIARLFYGCFFNFRHTVKKQTNKQKKKTVESFITMFKHVVTY